MRIKIEGADGECIATASRLIVDALAGAGFAVLPEGAPVTDLLGARQLEAISGRCVVAEVDTEPVQEPSWSPWRRGAQALVMSMCDGSVRGEGPFKLRELYDADFVAMVDPDDDNSEAVVAKCRWGLYAPGTYLTYEHVTDIALAYSAMAYASRHAGLGLDRYAVLHGQVVEACRLLMTESRRARLAGLLAQLL